MKIKITIQDTEDGHVRVDSDPHMTVLAAMARSAGQKDLTCAAGYALGALAKIIKDAQNKTAEEVRSKFDLGLIPAQKSNRPMFH